MIQFPVAVTMPDGTVHRPAKVYAHQGQTDIYVWDRDARDAALVATLTGEPESSGFRQWIVAVEAPEPVRIAATGGCGCGHPLKRWSPPRPVVG